ncbi:MAG: SET domain-containing protein-lysine N-methyltransferase [Candidatus Hodarchaeota archaeon]
MNNLIEVKFISSKKGKGLFAKQEIKKGKIIDVTHVVLIPNNDYELIDKTIISNYCYSWENPKYKSEYKMALAMSLCQFMNHSYNPNVRYEYHYRNDSIKYIAIKNISKGEELTMNYNGAVDDKSPVWFNVEE